MMSPPREQQKTKAEAPAQLPTRVPMRLASGSAGVSPACRGGFFLQNAVCRPGGTNDNSPAFERWEPRRDTASPEGTADSLATSTRWHETQSQPSHSFDKKVLD